MAAWSMSGIEAMKNSATSTDTGTNIGNANTIAMRIKAATNTENVTGTEIMTSIGIMTTGISKG
jgi:hypothetical protein